ncbi:hypothetical protein [Paracoccus sp. J56]|uniref:hypothetical protein n=1 Tax=Paracoccus sp. J56 TaxID=935850 RepID=UPI000A0E6FEF|nr:hypothetical protein [Paracoccus sp. J56]SMG51101.1 hypothetical protein SAMN02746000_03192 [Paracoccus sp. J56]
MIDILLLAGVALCALSVLLAIISVARTQAPRGAAVLLVLGIVLLLVGGWRDDRPFGLETLKESWQRLMKGEVSLSTDPVTAPAPAEPAATEAVQEPAEQPAATEATQPAAEEPAAEQPAATEPPAAPAAEEPAAEQPATEGTATETPAGAAPEGEAQTDGQSQ